MPVFLKQKLKENTDKQKTLPVRTVSNSVWTSGHGSSGHHTQNQSPQENWKQELQRQQCGCFMLWAAGGQPTTVCSWLLGQAETNGQTHWGPGTFLFINQEKEGALTRACTYFGKKALSTMWVKGKQRGPRAAENPCLISPAQGHHEEFQALGSLSPGQMEKATSPPTPQPKWPSTGQWHNRKWKPLV